MRCYYAPLLEKGEINLPESEKRHIFNVNKFRNGEEIIITDCKGKIASALVNSDRTINVLNIENVPEPIVKLHLYIASPRRQQMDQILEQSVEAGIWSINPILCERSISIPEKGKDNSRWENKLIEACKQAHNPYKPFINQPRSFIESLSFVKKHSYDSYYGALNRGAPLKAFKSSDIAWFVGPEGGFSENEITSFSKEGIKPLNLGRNVMRVETAAISGAVFLLNHIAEV